MTPTVSAATSAKPFTAKRKPKPHNEFHEQCVERIFCDLMHYVKPEKLTVYARYTRRGGLDINPFRSNFEEIPQNLRLARQ